jgi:hypothetical protein
MLVTDQEKMVPTKKKWCPPWPVVPMEKRAAEELASSSGSSP